MSRLSEKIIAALLGLFLLAYVGYQVYGLTYAPLKTEFVYDYTVSHTIPVEGLAIRSELVLNERHSGIEKTLYDDGTWVSIGQNVAEFYENEVGDRKLRRARELQTEIEMLVEAQDSTANNISNVDTLSRDIRDQLGSLTRVSSRGKYAQLGDVRANLVSLINRRQIATGKEDNFEERIANLRAEYDSIEQSDTGSRITAATAPVSGYFAKTVDGYEEIISPQILEGYRIDDYFKLLDAPPPSAPAGKIGKIITSQNWIFASAAPKQSLEIIKPGQKVSLNFDSLGISIPAVISEVMQEKDDDRAVLLLSCNQVSAELVNIRTSDASIHFDQVTGLRIDTANLRFIGEKRGVYVLEKNIVRFKLIDTVYEEQSFVLSRLNYIDSTDNEHVSLFEEIIVRGNDLYDGKVIQ